MTSVPAHRLAAGYFLGLVVAALLVFLWLRGGGRLLVPILLVGGVVYGLLRLLRHVRAPVD